MMDESVKQTISRVGEQLLRKRKVGEGVVEMFPRSMPEGNSGFGP